MAATSPGILYFRAWTFTRTPNSRKVLEVTGPMEATRIPRSAARTRPVPTSRAKLRAVEELVKVTQWGRGGRNAFRKSRRERGGATVW